MYFSRAIREDAAPGVTKVGPVRGGGADVEAGEVGGERRSRAAVASITGRSQRDVLLNRAALGFRVCEVIFCLISFSVMAADKTQGWTGDSFDRYKEYRFAFAFPCLIGVSAYYYPFIYFVFVSIVKISF